jgi:hypothetical protein
MHLFSRSKPTAEAVASIDNLVDAIIYLAGLVSNPSAIDPLLDDLRRITTRIKDGNLSASEQKQLTTTYLNIEEYLINKEPLRSFNKEELRNKFTGKLIKQINTNSKGVKWVSLNSQ